MKRILSLLSAALITAALFAQSAVLQVRELTLSNGMTVWLNEDHTQPKVFGVVVVRAGAKDCPDTGIAHYFEHIMFKGTDRIGTVDYEAERPWLDSISAQYDLLSQTNATALPGLSEKEIEARRTAIQHRINALSLRAADYAIPNEFSRLISQYGGSGLNAATGPDVTYYYNEFLPQYIGQWCWLNSERLLKPLFRGFQGELENVYEEKNRSADNFGGALDKVLKTVFKDQPYAYPVLGSTENLKNPRLSDMEAFYRQYYVAPNMCLMLVGDITPDSTLIGLLEQTFGRVQTGPVPTRTASTLPPFAKGEKAEVKVPIPLISARALVYATPTAFDADAPAMMVARQLLYNEQAGMLDSLVNEHRVMMAGMMGFDQLADAAADALFIVPKIPFGSMKKAEKACLEQLQRLIDGQFTDEQLQMQKRLLLMEAEQGLETIDDRAQHMIDVYARGRSWPQYLQQIEALRNVGRDDVMRVARKYYTADYLTLVKKFGIDRKDVLQQPGYLPVAPRNAGAKSAFAQWLDSLPVGHQPIRTVNLSSDVERIALGSHASLYCKQNPVNDIFTFCLRYYNGTRTTPLVAQLAQYLGTIGTDSLSKQQLEAAWQRMGVNMSVDTGDERTAFTLTGRDDQLEPALGLLAHFLARAQGDNRALKAMKQEAKAADKAFGKQKDDVLMPLIDYVSFGPQSDYLRQPSLKEVKSLSNDALMKLLKELQEYECDIVYCGRRPAGQVAELSQRLLPLAQCHRPGADTYRELQAVGQPTVYFYHVPRSRQNYVCSYEQLPPLPSADDRATARLWARYMGGGMSGVLFQHIREFRSLAYSTQGMLRQSNDARHEADAQAFITITGTQADKTLQAIAATDSLLRQMPMKRENLDAARQELLSNIQNSYPSFRTIGYHVANRLHHGYKDEPLRQLADRLPAIGAQQVEQFFSQHVAPNQRVWLIIGDRRLTNLKALEAFGHVVELKKADIYR